MRSTTALPGETSLVAVDPAFTADRQASLGHLDTLIARAEATLVAGGDPDRFPRGPGRYVDIPDSMTTAGRILGARAASPSLGKLAQHTMDTVINAMETTKTRDQDALESFLNPSPRWSIGESV